MQIFILGKLSWYKRNTAVHDVLLLYVQDGNNTSFSCPATSHCLSIRCVSIYLLNAQCEIGNKKMRTTWILKKKKKNLQKSFFAHMRCFFRRFDKAILFLAFKSHDMNSATFLKKECSRSRHSFSCSSFYPGCGLPCLNILTF